MFKNSNVSKEAEVGTQTVIGEGVKLEGNFSGQGDVIVDGAVNGTLKTTGNIQIGHAAYITAEIAGENISIAGKVVGNIKASGAIRIAKSAMIEGDLSCSDIVIESGSNINGRLNMGSHSNSSKSEEKAQD